MSNDLNRLLRETSRSFYLTLRVLPRAIRPQIGLAYLLARATDTIADAEAVPLTERLAALDALRHRILGKSSAPLDFTRVIDGGCGGSPAERTLLMRIEDALSALARQSAADQQLIRTVLTVITGGQELDLRRFEGASEQNIINLQTAAELDDYTYRVAGCVGEFWTDVCEQHILPVVERDGFLPHKKDGIRFGKGLQLVNILRDLPRDLRNGRCYLPADELRAAGLAPADLLDAANMARLQLVYDRWLATAEAHLTAGWNYTNAIPWNFFRLRLACAWPVLIGARTLAKLKAGNPLDPAQRIKVSRAEVRGILFGSLWRVFFPGAWRRQFDFGRAI